MNERKVGCGELWGEKVLIFMDIQLNKLTKIMHNSPNLCQITTHIVKFTNVWIVWS